MGLGKENYHRAHREICGGERGEDKKIFTAESAKSAEKTKRNLPRRAQRFDTLTLCSPFG
jgi:hypothetical protein